MKDYALAGVIIGSSAGIGAGMIAGAALATSSGAPIIPIIMGFTVLCSAAWFAYLWRSAN